jgi:Rv2258c-like winged HTH domain
MTTTTPSIEPTIQEQASVVLAHAAGYASHRTVAIGLRSGLLEALAASEHATPDELAERLGLDPFYVSVWCRSAFSAGICDRDAGSYRLAAHMATLLLDADSPAYAGGVFIVLEQPEMFGRFEANLASGERLWWDQTSPEHECRDIDQVTERVLASLEPGGWFVISDFPFPDTEQGLRSVPGRIMGAIQFFEAQIDDQLLTRAAYDHLLSRHGFTELGSFSLTPMHAVTHARKPR